jgi:hypothetical protein
LDSTARVEALRRTDAFDLIEYSSSAWSLHLDPEQTVALYATYWDIIGRPNREAVFTELGRIARDKFHGHVTRNMTTTLYMARHCRLGSDVAMP